jgi:hypothetical protein
MARLDWVAITRLLRYPALGGVTDFGLLRALGILGVPIRDISSAPNMKDLWLIDELITFIFTQGKLLLLSKLVFFLGYVAYVSKMRMRVFSLIGLCFSIIILLYTAVGGLSAQYLIWVLPFAIIERDRMSIWYSLIAGISLFGFYFTLYPEALIGLNAVPESIASAASTLWPRVTVILWATCAIWLYLRLKSGGAPNQESISLETPR